MVAPCKRCGVPCLVGATQPNEAPYPLVTMRAAQTADGLCSTCAAHWWLFTVDGLRWTFEEGYGMLSFLGIRTRLNRLLGLMHPELGAVDWDRMIAQWSLPWPRGWELPNDTRTQG